MIKRDTKSLPFRNHFIQSLVVIVHIIYINRCQSIALCQPNQQTVESRPLYDDLLTTKFYICTCNKPLYGNI